MDQVMILGQVWVWVKFKLQFKFKSSMKFDYPP